MTENMPTLPRTPAKTAAQPIAERPTRDGFGEGLVLAAKRDKSIVVLCADLTESTRVLEFKKQFPERFIQLGVSEQSLAAIAAGLALEGKTPFIASYAAFSPGRNWEQIRTNICLNDVPVKIVGAHAGVSVGPDGSTHQALEDIALMRCIPNMTVMYPGDAIEARKATIAAAAHPGPVYIRLAREKSPVFTAEKDPFMIGRANILREGKDCAIIGSGPLLGHALAAAEALRPEGISCMVVNLHTIKPIDAETVIAAARTCGTVVTVEEHQKMGGMGSAVAELLSQNLPTPIAMVGMNDEFGQTGEPEELIEHYGLGKAGIIAAVKKAIKMK
jgi:transketolase